MEKNPNKVAISFFFLSLFVRCFVVVVVVVSCYVAINHYTAVKFDGINILIINDSNRKYLGKNILRQTEWRGLKISL